MINNNNQLKLEKDNLHGKKFIVIQLKMIDGL